jgi:hypothetical protein
MIETASTDKSDQLYNVQFLPVLRQHLVTDSFGYDQFPEQKQLLQLAIEVYFPHDFTWQKTCHQLAVHQKQQTAVYAKEWLEYLLNFFCLYIFLEHRITLHAILGTKLVSVSDFLLFIRKHILKAYPDHRESIDKYFAPLALELNYHDLSSEQLFSGLNIKIAHEDLGRIYKDCLPELEPRSVIKFSETIRAAMSKGGLSFREKYHWKNWRTGSDYWKMFALQVVVLIILTIVLFWGIKTINQYYEKIIIEKITLLEPNFLWLDTNLTFKNESDVPQKAVRLASTQIDDLEKLERVEQSKFQETEFLPESDILDTSVAIGGWGGGFNQDIASDGETDQGIGNEYRDIYDGYSRSYRLMLNSADLFDMRQRIIDLFRRYKVKEANIPMVGKESLDGVYFNIFIPALQIQQFIQEIGGIETTNTYISKTSYRPPQGYERVFIWVKKI